MLTHVDEITWLLPRSPHAPAQARALLRAQFTEWDIGAEPTDSAELLLSELVTNAVRHARAPQGRGIGVRLARYDGVLRVEVADAGPPVKLTPQVVADWDEQGRGLAIVAALAERWGQCPRLSGIGKAVWAEVRCGASGGVRGRGPGF
ncbi:ATP-binding protein [Streptomyces goshikiensis]